MASFDRGFKSWAEKCALSFRKDLGLKFHDPLCALKLAEYLQVDLWTPQVITGMTAEDLDQLLKKDPEGWSAITILRDGKPVVIYNPSHKDTRQTSDIMHEIAHIVAGHEPSKMILAADGKFAMRTFDQKHEDEALWLSGCLILPRDALLHSRKSRLSDDEIQKKYSATLSILRMRLAVTGVERQLRFIKRPEASQVNIARRPLSRNLHRS